MTWGTPVESVVFLGLLVFKLEPMYATSDRQTTDADHRLMPPLPLWGGGIITEHVALLHCASNSQYGIVLIDCVCNLTLLMMFVAF